MSRHCQEPGCDIIIQYSGRGRPPEYCREHGTSRARQERSKRRQAELAPKCVHDKVIGTCTEPQCQPDFIIAYIVRNMMRAVIDPNTEPDNMWLRTLKDALKRADATLAKREE